jgi:hypothetical protein
MHQGWIFCAFVGERRIFEGLVAWRPPAAFPSLFLHVCLGEKIEGLVALHPKLCPEIHYLVAWNMALQCGYDAVPCRGVHG